MGPPETPAQCLCPLGRDSSDGNGVEKRRAHVVDHVDRSLIGSFPSSKDSFSQEKRKSNPETEFKQSGFSPLSSISTPLLRRSTPTTFYEGGDAQQCIDACRQGFLQSGLLSSSPAASSGTPSLANTCSLLSNSATAQQELWQLYWCDSVFCGVWIDDSGGKGQDPNVDLIINECQNIGYSSIYDPGPPPSTYHCSSLLASGSSANPCRNLAAIATETVVVSATSSANTMEASTTLTTQHLSQHLTTAPGPENTGKSLAFGGNVVSAAAATGSQSSNSSNENGKNITAAGTTSGPSAGVKGAIVAIIVVAVLVIAGIVFFFIRRRRNNMLGQAYQHRGGGNREGGGGPSRHRPSHGNGSSGSIGLTERLRHQGQMLFYPGHGRGDGEVPTPLISPANSCNSVRGVSSGTGASQSASPKRAGVNLLATLRLARTSSEDRAPSQHSTRSRSIIPSFFSRRARDRSISPPLTSLSPPPSPTQMSARGRHDIDGNHDGDGPGIAGKNGNRVSAANSGSSYYGYYGYNGHFVPYYFPSSPICAPTTNKLEPRREKTPTIRPNKQQEEQKLEQQKQQQQRHGYYNFQTGQTDGGSPVPPLPPLPVSIFNSQAAGGLDAISHRGPRSSYGSYSTVNNASSNIIPASNLYGNAVTTDTMEPMTPLASISPLPSLPGAVGPSASSSTAKPASPVRPKRPHESPLEIPDLVMPDPPLPSLFHAKNSSNASDRSFSMPGRTYSTTATSRRVVTTGAPAVAKREESTFLPRGPPPNRGLPSPPPAPKSLPPEQPSSTEDQDARESIESLELPPLLMRDDDDYDESGDTYIAWNASSRSSSRKYHHAGNKPPTTIASFSSTMSTSSMLSSSTAETATTTTTITSAPFASASTSTTTSPQPQRPFCHGTPFTVSSILTIRPTETSQPAKEKTLSTAESAASDSLFPPRPFLDSEDI